MDVRGEIGSAGGLDDVKIIISDFVYYARVHNNCISNNQTGTAPGGRCGTSRSFHPHLPATGATTMRAASFANVNINTTIVLKIDFF